MSKKPNETTSDESFHTAPGSKQNLPEPKKEPPKKVPPAVDPSVSFTPSTADLIDPNKTPTPSKTSVPEAQKEKPSTSPEGKKVNTLLARLRAERSADRSAKTSANYQFVTKRDKDGRIIDWPESGCIHIPLNPDAKRSDEANDEEEEDDDKKENQQARGK